MSDATYECATMVKEFMAKRGWTPETRVAPETAVLRVRLIVEELAETVIALQENDGIGAADGMADLLYVVYGTAAAYGIDSPDVFIDATRGPAPAFGREAVACFTSDALCWAAVAAESLAAKRHGRARLTEALGGLAEAVCRCSAGWGIPLYALYAEVHRSNMTKDHAVSAGDKNAKVGKGASYSPPDVAGVLTAAKNRFKQK